MKRNKTTIKFEKHFLDDLVKDPQSCVVMEEHQYHLALHPFHLNNIKESVKDIFNKGIAKYNKKLDGILLGYEEIKLLSDTGSLLDDNVFIHLDISALFYLFKPAVGKELVGTVNKKSKDHVGCLLLQIFNVSLPRAEDDENWIGSRVEVGQDIQFRINFLNLESRLPYIRADFVRIINEPDSGISSFEEGTESKSKRIVFESSSDVEEEKVIKKHKKKKKTRLEPNEEENAPFDESSVCKATKSKKAKHKKSLKELSKDELGSYKHKKRKSIKELQDNDFERNLEASDGVKRKSKKRLLLLDTSEDVPKKKRKLK